jgi:hypothetical protein
MNPEPRMNTPGLLLASKCTQFHEVQMSDGREEREEREKRREQEDWRDRQDRLERHDEDQWQPERPES